MAKKKTAAQPQRITVKSDILLDYKINEKFELSEMHSSFLETMLESNSKVGFIDGPAGTAKTYLAALASLKLLHDKRIQSIVYIRSIAESASIKMGSLPGEIDEKFSPWAMPLLEKLDEIIPGQTSQELMKSGYIKCVPVNYVRGLTFHESCVIIDEAQNMTHKELVTILTRFGRYSRYMIIGDTLQSDINGKSGFAGIYNAFDKRALKKEGFHTFKFGEDEIVRSPELRTIVKVLEGMEKKSSRSTK